MRQQLRAAATVLGAFTVLTGVIYPLVVTVFAQTFFPGPANGSLLDHAGQPVGSALIGQPFTKPEYFWGRLSATSPVPYNAAASGGANLGPLNPTLTANASERLDALRAADPNLALVPSDLVTASGSGLDPHISPAAAAVQIQRVANARKMTVPDVQRLVEQHTEGRQFGLLGEPRVHVLRLNLALDAFAAPHP